MSWEIFVQVWLYTIVGFVVGVGLTLLFAVLPLRRKLRALESERARSAQQQDRQDRPRRSEPTLRAAEAGGAPGEAAAETPTARQSQERVFAPRTDPPAPVPEETPEEQTIVLEAFDFGGPDSRTQTRTLPEEDDQPWQPEVRIDPNDRLSEQFAKRSAPPEPQLPTRNDGGNGTQGPFARPAADEPASFMDEPFKEGPSREGQDAAPADAFRAFPDGQDTGTSDDLPPQGAPKGAAFSYLSEPVHDAPSSGFPEPFKGVEQDAEPLPQRRPGAAGAAAAYEGPLAGSGPSAGGSLFDPSAGMNTGPPDVRHGDGPPAGPFGAGSALPRPDGSSPSPEFTVKARTSSMVFHTERSPFFDRLLPQVWFRSVEDAQRAGFAGWDEAHEG